MSTAEIFPNPLTFPSVIDNTMRADYFDCPTKFLWSHIYKLGPKEPSTDLHAGGAFAAGMEAIRNAYFRDKLPFGEAFEVGAMSAMAYWGNHQVYPGKGNKDLPRVITALAAYFEKWPIATDYFQPFILEGKTTVEFTFAYPLPIDHPETGEPIIYAGRLDALGTLRGDTIIWCDEKTTSYLGASWARKWQLRSQLLGYTWVIRKMVNPLLKGGVVRGTSFLKNSHECLEALVLPPEWLINNWYGQLLRDVGRMVRDFSEGSWDQALGEACIAYGGCPFQKLCLSNEPTAWFSHYGTRKWNPLEKNPLIVPERPELPPIEFPEGAFKRG